MRVPRPAGRISFFCTGGINHQKDRSGWRSIAGRLREWEGPAASSHIPAARQDGCRRGGPACRSRGLLLEAARGVAVALVSSFERKRRQPGFAADGPELVGRPQLVGGIEGPEVDLDL